MKRSEIAFGLARIPVDFFMTIGAFLLAYKLRTLVLPGINIQVDITQFQPLPEYLRFSFAASTALCVIYALNKMYSLRTTFKLTQEISKVIVLNSILLMLIILYYFVIREFPFSRLVLIYMWGLSIGMVSLGRMCIKLIQRQFLKAGIGQRRILFIGNNILTEELFKKLQTNPAYKCIGLIDNELKKSIKSLKPLGKLHELEKIVNRFKIEEIIQTKQGKSNEILDFCQFKHIGYSFVPDLLEVHRTNINVRMKAGIPLITLAPTPLDGWGKVIKRIFDILGSLFGLIILFPVFLITAIAIRIDSKGPIFFTKLDDGSPVMRVGQYGKLIPFYKFRSMHPGTHNQRYTCLSMQDQRKGSPLVKIKDDPRITRVGRFIRKTSIDELPQLWNVFKGELSLVGPRAHLPEEVEKYENKQRFVLTIKPGITGMAQISGRSDLEFEEEVRLDTYYIEHWSLWLDIKIILKTFGVLVEGYDE